MGIVGYNSACNDRGTGSIYFDVTSIHNIVEGSIGYADENLTIPFVDIVFC